MFFVKTESIFFGKQIVSDRIAKFQVYCTQTSRRFTPSFLFAHIDFPFSAATKITRTFPFYQLLAAVSTHCNFDFPQNPILRLMKILPFPPVQNMAVLFASAHKTPCFGGLRHAKTCHRQLLTRPSTCFSVTFCTPQKVTEKPSF